MQYIQGDDINRFAELQRRVAEQPAPAADHNHNFALPEMEDRPPEDPVVAIDEARELLAQYADLGPNAAWLRPAEPRPPAPQIRWFEDPPPDGGENFIEDDDGDDIEIADFADEWAEEEFEEEDE